MERIRIKISVFKIFFCFLTLNLQSQPSSNLIEITHNRKGSNYDFFCQNNTNCPYLVKVEFSTLSNLKSSRNTNSEITVYPGNRKIFSLEPIRDNQFANFQYKWTYRKGTLKVKIKPTEKYIIPLKDGKSTKCIELKHLSDVIKSTKEKPENWYAMGFSMPKGDTVIVSMGGRVIDMYKEAATNDSNLSFHQNRNYVEVLHKNGTIAKYELFQKGGIFVQLGDKVVRGQPLGIIGGNNYNTGSHLRFSVYYALKKGGYAYLPIAFYNNGKKQILDYNEFYQVIHSIKI